MTTLRLAGNTGIDALLGEISRFGDVRVPDVGPAGPATQETAVGGDAALPPGGGRTVDHANRALARAGVLASGANLQHQLLQQTGGDTSAAAASATRGGDVLDRALQQQILGLMQDLGYDVKNLDAEGLKNAINEVKSYAGLRPDGTVDLDLLMALFMAKAEQDRHGRGGGGGGPKGYSSRPSGGGGGSRPSGGSGGAQGGSSSGASGSNRNSGVQLSRTREVDTANWRPGRGDVTPDQLVQIAQRSGHQLSPQRAREVAPHLNRAMAEANIDTPRKKSAFIAQLMHESGGFRYNEEIASGAAYEGRRDLGNTQPGDGRRFKGRGFIQLTGRANYEAAGRALGLDLVNNPQQAASDANAARVAAWYWNSRGLNQLAEQGNFDAVTRRINGGFNGKADRDRLYRSAMGVLRDNHGLPSTGQAEPEAAGGTTRASSVDATRGMTEAQKYDYYKNLIEQNGGTVSGEPGQRNIVGIRQENHRVNRYDDRMAVIWRDETGNPRVREFDANMESISRYQGRYGNDVNGDGRRDLATLTAGTHSFAKDYSGQFGNILRPTSTTAVTRDTDGDGRGDTLDRNGAGRSILFHKGGRTDTGSAGCQTMDPATFEAFWQTLGNQRSFQYTVVDV